MGKAFEKQTKTIEDQVKRQIDAFSTLKSKEQETSKDNKSDDNEKSLKYKEFFYKLYRERIGEISKISNEIGYDNLIYCIY